MRSTFLAVFFSASCGFGLLVALGQPLAMPPGSGLDAPPGSPQTYAGKVIETMNSGGYTYIKLATPEGEIWGAVTPASVKVGDSAKIVSGVVMTDFEAKSLGRKFDRIVFGSLEAEASGSPHPGGRLGAGQATVSKKVEKAEGADGRTVAELWAQRADLEGKPVSLRGQVVKFNAGIMGKNWLHLQDGTGTPEASNFDVTVTTADEAKVGDVVVVRGVVQVDKNLGAGYVYPVLVEDAKITR